MEAFWAAAREAERLRASGLELLTATDSGVGDVQKGSLDEPLARLEGALTEAGGVLALTPAAEDVQNAAYDLVDVIDDLSVNRAAMLDANAAAADLRSRMEGLPAETETSVAGLRLLGRVLRVDDDAAVQGM